MQNPSQRLNLLRAAVNAAALRAGRSADDIRLIGASKAQSVAAIRSLAELGVRDFGENYVQEALHKQALLTDLGLTWHFIGRIQSNKTRDIASHFEWVHSVDRLGIARRLSNQHPIGRAPINICLQVNAQAEPSKGGVPLNELQALARAVAELPGVRLRGLMTIPRPSDNPAQQRLPYRKLREALLRLNAEGMELDTLSMGMSADMDAAIAEGATMIRIGTALFGPRPAEQPQDVDSPAKVG